MTDRLILGIGGVLAICAACIPPIDGTSIPVAGLGLTAIMFATIFWKWIKGDY